MQQEQDITQKWKRNFNICYSFAMWHQRALILPMRNRFGTEALGFPCFFAFVLMIGWYVCTRDTGLLLWMGVCLIFQIMRRIEAVKLAGRVHSQYAGWPFDAIRFCGSERIAKLIVEPIIVGAFGALLFWIYTVIGWRPTGLPYFFLAGIFTLPFVESVKQTAWNRRVQAMRDAQFDQEALSHEFQE